MVWRSKASATFLVIIVILEFSSQTKSTMISDLMFFNTLFRLVIWLLLSSINFVLLLLFIGTITCFLEWSFVIILIFSLGLLLPLMIFWMLLILSALRLEKTFLILRTFLMVFLDFDIWAYNLSLLLSSLVEPVILKYFNISLTSLGNLARIGGGSLLILMGLFIFIFFFTSIDWIYLRGKFEWNFLLKEIIILISDKRILFWIIDGWKEFSGCLTYTFQFQNVIGLVDVNIFDIFGYSAQ